ncbi:ER-derived vesicles protein erv29 [Hypoxylon texense]
MSATVTSKAAGQTAETAPKHRACDECRTRKLACTKEPDGCSRCKREAITCHYSPQKPMGRPRKRPRDEASNGNSTETQATQNTTKNTPPDTVDAGRFINLLSGGEVNYDVLENGSQEKGFPWSFGYTGDSLGDIGFDPVPEHAPLFSPSNIDPSLFVSTAAVDAMIIDPPSAEQVPNLSPNSASTPESVGSACSAPQPDTPPVVGCAHTAALYLALDSMQKPPQDVEEAIRHARRATKTAYDVVYCPVCSFRIEPPEDAASADVMRNFQNLMLLAALIPSIVLAYERILQAVDEAANRAVAERRRLVFKLRGLGGILWGAGAGAGAGAAAGGSDSSSTHHGGDCGAADALNHREMEPAMWRLTVRALLKADVYGLSGMEPDAATYTTPLHIGLKDIVLQMEQKSKARHAVMDILVHSGAWRPPNCGLPIHRPGETPTCQKVIAIAKASIDQLVIA